MISIGLIVKEALDVKFGYIELFLIILLHINKLSVRQIMNFTLSNSGKSSNNNRGIQLSSTPVHRCVIVRVN